MERRKVIMATRRTIISGETLNWLVMIATLLLKPKMQKRPLEHYSVILTMFYVNELSHKEISEILSLPLGTIKNRIFRAKEKLKEVLLRKYPTEELLEYI